MPQHRIVIPIFTTDPDGTPIAMWQLASGHPVKMDAADAHAWIAAGRSLRMTLNASGPGPAYVRAARSRASGRLIGVARTIMDAGKDKIVKYHNGDRTDLRRSNLYLTSGRAKRHDATIPAAPPRSPSASPQAAE